MNSFNFLREYNRECPIDNRCADCLCNMCKLYDDCRACGFCVVNGFLCQPVKACKQFYPLALADKLIRRHYKLDEHDLAYKYGEYKNKDEE